MKNFINSSVCPAGNRRIFVDSKGDFTPCPFINLKIGNLLDNKVNEDFIYFQFLKFNEFIRKIQIKDKCKECPVVNICDGGCKAITIMEKEKSGKNGGCCLQLSCSFWLEL